MKYAIQKTAAWHLNELCIGARSGRLGKQFLGGTDQA